MSKILKATHGSDKTVIHLKDGTEIPCYVLENGERVLSQSGMIKALGLQYRGAGKDSPARLARFAGGKRVSPFISSDIMPLLETPIQFKVSGGIAYGYEATILIDICDAVIEARKQKKLQKQQAHIADNAEKLIRAFAKTGIIAVIDEITGYQYDREKNELQVILSLFISPEILEWQKEFHLGFYKEIFRLWRIPFTEYNIRHKPSFVGHLTNSLVYNNLPKGSWVLKKLKEKTPKTAAGNYTARLHQSLTPFGKEELRKIIYSVESFATLCETKDKLIDMVNQRYGKVTLPLFKFDEPIPKKIQTEPTFNETLKGLLNTPPPKRDDTEGNSPTEPKE